MFPALVGRHEAWARGRRDGPAAARRDPCPSCTSILDSLDGAATTSPSLSTWPSPSPDGAPAGPVRSGSTAMQTHLPADRSKRTCKSQVFVKRLKGFEPSTFCMASSSYRTGHDQEPPANARMSAGRRCQRQSREVTRLPGVWAPNGHPGLSPQEPRKRTRQRRYDGSARALVGNGWALSSSWSTASSGGRRTSSTQRDVTARRGGPVALVVIATSVESLDDVLIPSLLQVGCQRGPGRLAEQR
jgi:hypothetical protein